MTDQAAFDVRCEWGPQGVEALADCRTFIIVDALSFSTCVATLLDLPVGSRLVLPSPNGAALALAAARHGHVLAGCLRNRMAVCARAVALRGPYAVIPAGERWPDGGLRPAIEDLIAAGAIAAMLPGSRSPEASIAVAAFVTALTDLRGALASCASGVELAQRGFPDDIELAAQLDASVVAPELVDGVFVEVGQRWAASPSSVA
jgi:2-phosphosulfolactate phosphatase